MTLGGGELLVVFAIALFLFGPKKLPELARSLGKAVAEYHKAQREFEAEIQKAKSSVDREVTAIKTDITKVPEPGSVSGSAASHPRTPARETSYKPYSSMKIKEIAKNLGIDTENKTDAQILKEIAEVTAKREKEKAAEKTAQKVAENKT